MGRKRRREEDGKNERWRGRGSGDCEGERRIERVRGRVKARRRGGG